MPKTATVHRMAIGHGMCPSGLKSVDLLRREGFEIDDNLLTTREQVDAFKARHGVATTPQTFIGSERVGGYDDLRKRLGKPVRAGDKVDYAPLLAVFVPTALMALALCWNLYGSVPVLRWLQWFVALSMVVLAVQKLRDLEGFTNGFLGYDLLARRWVPYAYVYPFAEAFAGIGMMALIGSGSALAWFVAPVALLIGAVGAASVIKAVYIDKRELKCACVGGNSNVPLGAISLTENLMMVAMGTYTIATLLT